MDIRYKGQSLTVGETLKDEILRAVVGHSADGTAHGDLRALWAALAARAAALEKSLTGAEKLTGTADPTAQITAQEGQVYLNTATGQEFVCAAVTEDGTVWEERANSQVKLDIFAVGTAPPEDRGLLWIDTDASTGGLKYWDGAKWAHVPVAYT